MPSIEVGSEDDLDMVYGKWPSQLKHNRRCHLEASIQFQVRQAAVAMALVDFELALGLRERCETGFMFFESTSTT